MGLFDQLGGMLEGGGEGQSANIVGALLSGGGAAAGSGGIAGVLETLAANGFSEHVASWTAGANLPISPQQIESALGSEQVQQLARSSGLPVGDFLQHLSQHLPAAAAAASGSREDH
ncbi:MAG TPA: YidB family protein [Caulobacteraceae bacterium]|jgi:uncharacterized protein YidB (DUF937 family)|nr:YidB family protein [Caulobacteraceae bacterium]